MFGDNLETDLDNLKTSAEAGTPLFHKVRIEVKTPNVSDYNNTILPYYYFYDRKGPTLTVHPYLGVNHGFLNYFPYKTASDGETGPGFCIVPIYQKKILTTGKFSGCGISIYDINNYRIYVHNEHLNGRIQLNDPNEKSKFLVQLFEELDNMPIPINDKNNIVDTINIDAPTYSINGSIGGRFNPFLNETKSDYDYYNSYRLTTKYHGRKLIREYSSIIYQEANGNINVFFFPISKERIQDTWIHNRIYIEDEVISYQSEEGNVLIKFNNGNRTPIYCY